MNADLIKHLLDFLSTLLWTSLFFSIFFYFSKPIRNILTSTHIMIKERGVKLTNIGIEVPGLHNETEPVSTFLTEPKFAKRALSLNKPEELESPLTEQSSNLKDVLEQHQKNLVDDTLDAIRNFIKEKSEQERQDLLKGLLCDAYICLYFERSYQRILGSQLKFMLYILNIFSGKIDKSEAINYFDSHIVLQNKDEISFERWISFLVNNNFVKKNVEAFFLTDEGKEFLQYIKEREYSLTKSF